MKKDLKLIRSLHLKKFRQETGLFIVEGKKSVEEALSAGCAIDALFTTDVDWSEKQEGSVLISAKEMDQMTALNTPSSHLAVVQKWSMKPLLHEASKTLVLDGISDPGNLGTIMRTAEWFGMDQIIATPDTVELYNPKVVQSTMGSIFRMPYHVLTFSAIQEFLSNSNIELIGADMSGIPVHQFDFQTSTALVIGSESHGVRPEMRGIIARMITIPGKGKAESLNASMAAGIIMSHWATK